MAFFENASFAKEEFDLQEDILQIKLPSANLNRFISTPLQSLLSNIQSSELCYIPEQYILNGSTQADESISIKPASDNSETGLACGLPVVPLSVGNVSVPPNG